jgi:hypothetical protein
MPDPVLLSLAVWGRGWMLLEVGFRGLDKKMGVPKQGPGWFIVAYT